MSTKGRSKEQALQKWLAEEKTHSEDLDRMLLEQSRRHRALQKRSKIGRFLIKR